MFFTIPEFYSIVDSSIDDDVSRDLSVALTTGNLDFEYMSIEKNHMKDVFFLMKNLSFIHLVLGILILVFVTFQEFNAKKVFFLAYLMLLILIIFLIVFFDKAFILFHEIFFTNQNWIFPYESVIIQNLNQMFFLKAFVWIFFFVSFYFYVLYLILKRRSCKNSPN